MRILKKTKKRERERKLKKVKNGTGSLYSEKKRLEHRSLTPEFIDLE